MVLKRFWKLITLSIVIIAVLVTYFVHTALVVASQFPELEIKTISGDESVLNNVNIIGDYYQGDNYTSSLMVSLEGSTYYEELSYFEKLEPHFPPNEVSKIKDRYSNFMRGKQYSPSSFYENDDYLAYVRTEISDWDKNYLPGYYFEVDVLNKETKKSHSFQTNIPGVENIHYADVLDVQMINGELKVITNINFMLNERHVDEIKVFTMDISSEEIIGDQTLFDPKEQNNNDKWSHMMFLNDRSELDSGNNLLLQKDIGRDVEVTQSDENTDEIRTELLERTFHVYNLKTKQLQELHIPEEQHKELLLDDSRTNGFVNNTHAFVTYFYENNLVVLSFSLEDMKVETTQVFNLEELGIKDYSLKTKDNKLYAVEFAEGEQKSAKIFVGDMLTGKVLYNGEIAVKNEKNERKDYYLQFYTIVIN